MKNFKIALLALFLGAIAIVGTASKASAQTTQYYTFNTTFVLGTTPSTPISTPGNWTSAGSDPVTICPGGTLLCGFKVVINSGSPTFQNIIDAIKEYYDTHSNSLPHNTSFNKTVPGSYSITITPYLKS